MLFWVRCWCVRFALWTFVFRTSCVFGGKKTKSTSGYQYWYSIHSYRTGEYKFTSISSFFFRFLAQTKTSLWRVFRFCFQNLSMKECMWPKTSTGWKRMKYQELALTFNKWLCVHDDVNIINKRVKERKCSSFWIDGLYFLCFMFWINLLAMVCNVVKSLQALSLLSMANVWFEFDVNLLWSFFLDVDCFFGHWWVAQWRLCSKDHGECNGYKERI